MLESGVQVTRNTSQCRRYLQGALNDNRPQQVGILDSLAVVSQVLVGESGLQGVRSARLAGIGAATSVKLKWRQGRLREPLACDLGESIYSRVNVAANVTDSVCVVEPRHEPARVKSQLAA